MPTPDRPTVAVTTEGEPSGTPVLATPSTPVAMYLDLMKRCLTNWIYASAEDEPFDPEKRSVGLDWPPTAHTMIGLRRLENIQLTVEDVLNRGVPGDLIETGVWRGGATIFMRAILRAHGCTDRRVWVADSFQGLPPPDQENFPADAGIQLHAVDFLRVSLDQVKANFEAYGLLDEQVRFLPGWFKDTLPSAPVERIAVLRLDGDMYESTMQALDALYDKVSVGGYVLIDDYGVIEQCRRAVHDFRSARSIQDPLLAVDWTGVYWQRSG